MAPTCLPYIDHIRQHVFLTILIVEKSINIVNLDSILADDADFRKLQRAIAVVRDARGLEPDFALTNVYLARRLGMDTKDSLFILGRAVGWIAHSIEQYEVGGVIREPAMYTGPLPV